MRGLATMNRPSHRMICMIILVVVLLIVECHGARPSILRYPLTAEVATRGGAAAATAGPFQLFVETVQTAKKHLIAAAVARSVSIFAMFPVDTIKTRYQMQQANPLRMEGIYNGVAGSLFGQVPYGVLTFGSYEMYKTSLLSKFPSVAPIWIYAIAAVLGDLTGSGWLCPSEVVKQQLQAGMYSSTTSAVRSIVSKQGIRGLYQGYWGGVARDVPFRVAQLTSYEVTKNLYLRLKKTKKGEKKQLSAVDTAVCGAIAGTFSAAITCPLDRIKTLLMTDSAAVGGSVVACAKHIYRTQGLAGFAAGMVPRVVYIAPSVVVFFIAYEQVQQKLVARELAAATRK